jgi:Na+-transporting methylmalonyl-CoA/oxaloacetate decarboxylase gamma subunit
MQDNLSAALQISLVGMSFVLAALALLWLVMAVLVRLAADPIVTRPEPSTEVPAPPALARQAAAVAVVVALALRAAHPTPAPSDRPDPQVPSAWQAVMRAQLLKQRERRR